MCKLLSVTRVSLLSSNLLNDRQKRLALQARRDADLIQLICAKLQEQLAIDVVLLERGTAPRQNAFMRCDEIAHFLHCPA